MGAKHAAVKQEATPIFKVTVKNSERKQLLVVSSVWPHVAANFEAANVICHSIVTQLLNAGDFDVSYAYVNAKPATIPEPARAEIEALRARGINFVELLLPPPWRIGSNPLRFLRALLKPEIILNGHGNGERLLKSLGDRKIDAALEIWSEVGANVVSELPVVRFAYHGNPDPKVFAAQHEALRLVGAQPRGFAGALSWLRRSLLGGLLVRGHLAVMRRFKFVANVAANDAAYHAENGVEAFYLPNMWPTLPPADWESRRDALEQMNPGKIVGSIGNKGATGNSLGFIALGQEVLPELKHTLQGTSFTVHIFGGGQVKPALQFLLNDPCIQVRGFVEDLDAEILSAPVFLIANNHHHFKVGHTRFLHAWSLGACVVAFSDCRDAMPEIKHGYNALLGNTPAEVAALVAQAMADRDLRRRIGRGGVETLQRVYSPSVVTRTLIERMRAGLGLSCANEAATSNSSQDLS